MVFEQVAVIVFVGVAFGLCGWGAAVAVSGLVGKVLGKEEAQK